ncbi:MAG: response regulator [bacterium]
MSPLVIIIDDEVDITTFLGLALEDAGYRVQTLNEATHAMELLRRERPDLICLDLLMPEQTGASLYQEIRLDTTLRQTPVLILSGLNAREELGQLLHQDPNLEPPAGYLEKPVEAEAFLQLIQQLLGVGDTPDGESPA